MPAPVREVDIYLDDAMLASAERGEHNYIAKLQRALEGRGFVVGFQRNSLAARIGSAERPGYAIFHMDPPTHERALTTRRAYYYPFWRIETVAERWDWEVARSAFPRDEIDAEEAARFCRFWRKRLFGPVLAQVAREGYVFAPLQGRLLERRSFQHASPMEMLERTLAIESRRRVVAALHPKERYGDAELAALDRLAAREPRFSLSARPSEALLAGCDYVVTENSALALGGFFLGKPAVLFARIDFHHVAADVARLGEDAAFERAAGEPPDFERYLYWFLQLTAINAGRDDAEDRIVATLGRRGWPV